MKISTRMMTALRRNLRGAGVLGVDRFEEGPGAGVEVLGPGVEVLGPGVEVLGPGVGPEEEREEVTMIDDNGEKML